MMGDVRCPKCGRKTTIRTAKKDDCQYHVCINSPRCKGRVLVDEDHGDDWGDDWDEERPATKAASGRHRQPRAPETAQGEPQQQIVPMAYATPEKKKPARPRRRRVPQRYLIPERKKRSLAVIIIALIIAFLAIDGIIYAAFVLR